MCAGADEKTKVKVLVVDDEVFVRDVLNQRLTAEGFEVVLARNGNEALEEIMNHPDIAVLFTDLRMPTMNGLELIRHIRSIMSEVLVVVISGFLDSLKEAEGQDLALIDETLEKPFTGAEFRRVLDFVHQKIDQKRKLSVA
jgi:CheY-like chemotaxis protein